MIRGILVSSSRSLALLMQATAVDLTLMPGLTSRRGNVTHVGKMPPNILSATQELTDAEAGISAADRLSAHMRLEAI